MFDTIAGDMDRIQVLVQDVKSRHGGSFDLSKKLDLNALHYEVTSLVDVQCTKVKQIMRRISLFISQHDPESKQMQNPHAWQDTGDNIFAYIRFAESTLEDLSTELTVLQTRLESPCSQKSRVWDGHYLLDAAYIIKAMAKSHSSVCGFHTCRQEHLDRNQRFQI